MPSGDWVKSLTEVGASAPNQAIAFTTTRWSVVLTAQGESPAADQALEKLCRTYWWPLYGFVKRQGYAAEEAQDLTQGFFASTVGEERFGCCPAGEGAYALLSPRRAEKFSRQGTSAYYGSEARRRQAARAAR